MSDIDSYLVNLNTQQIEAVVHDKGPILVLAGAGTGKTRVLTTKIIHLCKTMKAFPNEILAVTFTNKASKEMIARIAEIIPATGLWLGTFHSIAVRLLRRHSELLQLTPDFIIIGVDEQIKIIKAILKKLNISDKDYTPKSILGVIQGWKDYGLRYKNLKDSDLVHSTHHIAKEVYKEYTAKLAYLDAVDFGDLLLLNIDLFNKYPDVLQQYQKRFKYILVDEYQDTNVAQYMWLRMLVNEEKNICCVGDEDQSIYGWRGAEIGNILRFGKDYKNAKIIRLEQNYRSTNNILNVASGLISKNSERLGKKLWSANSKGGDKVQIYNLVDDNEEANFCAKLVNNEKNFIKRHIAILVRASFQTRAIEDSFIRNSINYRIIGGLKFYERQEIKDIIAYIRLVVNHHDSLALERIINIPRRGIGPATIIKINEFAIENNISMFPAVQQMLNESLLKGKVSNELTQLTELIAEFKQNIETLVPSELVEDIIKKVGYVTMLKNDKSIESAARIENIKEFINALKEFDDIYEFIEYVSLVSDNDSSEDDDAVNIMTIHASKGLEFDMVILPGWEEGVFPHQRAIEDQVGSGLEEERRLAYVAITRAKKKLNILHASARRTFGQWQVTSPSRFIRELPKEFVDFQSSYNSGNNKAPYNRVAISANHLGFQLGDRVRHNKFGDGYVVRIQDNQLEISFDLYGSKILLEGFVSKIK